MASGNGIAIPRWFLGACVTAFLLSVGISWGFYTRSVPRVEYTSDRDEINKTLGIIEADIKELLQRYPKEN